MWLRVSLPAFGSDQAKVRLSRFHAGQGDRLARGDALLDLIVDLSGGVVRDCPPISTCRIIIREEAWLRDILVGPDRDIEPGRALALLSTAPDSPFVEPAREARVTAATMLQHADWWTYGT